MNIKGERVKITRRGRIVRALLIGAGIALALWVSGNIWWTGENWCRGSLSECVEL
jgi:hypothetical protein